MALLCIMFNAQSVANKMFDIFVDALADNRPYLILRTETWLCNDTFIVPTIFNYNCNLLHCDCTVCGKW